MDSDPNQKSIILDHYILPELSRLIIEYSSFSPHYTQTIIHKRLVDKTEKSLCIRSIIHSITGDTLYLLVTESNVNEHVFLSVYDHDFHLLYKIFISVKRFTKQFLIHSIGEKYYLYFDQNYSNDNYNILISGWDHSKQKIEVLHSISMSSPLNSFTIDSNGNLLILQSDENCEEMLIYNLNGQFVKKIVLFEGQKHDCDIIGDYPYHVIDRSGTIYASPPCEYREPSFNPGDIKSLIVLKYLPDEKVLYERSDDFKLEKGLNSGHSEHMIIHQQDNKCEYLLIDKGREIHCYDLSTHLLFRIPLPRRFRIESFCISPNDTLILVGESRKNRKSNHKQIIELI